ncbi:MAG: DUF5610 domain-containing protein [Nitrosomonadales bacterium]|nr:DUF5610 domain-containing protein [Nitrosomonadales bacterium]
MKIESVVQSTYPTTGNKPEAGQPATVTGQSPQQVASAKSAIDVSRQTLNKSILETSMDVSISVGNDSMRLLLKAAVEHLNQVLAPDFGNNAIQKASESGVDYSPQATADRIVSMSTAFFGKYLEKYPEKDIETALKDFTKLIGGGIDQGFAEARQILDGLRVLQGDIASNIDKTYELVQAGLKSFVDNYPRPDKPAAISAKSAA